MGIAMAMTSLRQFEINSMTAALPELRAHSESIRRVPSLYVAWFRHWGYLPDQAYMSAPAWHAVKLAARRMERLDLHEVNAGDAIAVVDTAVKLATVQICRTSDAEEEVR